MSQFLSFPISLPLLTFTLLGHARAAQRASENYTHFFAFKSTQAVCDVDAKEIRRIWAWGIKSTSPPSFSITKTFFATSTWPGIGIE